MKQFSILVGYQPIFRENIIIQSSDWKIEKNAFQFNTTPVGTCTYCKDRLRAVPHFSLGMQEHFFSTSFERFNVAK